MNLNVSKKNRQRFRVVAKSCDAAVSEAGHDHERVRAYALKPHARAHEFIHTHTYARTLPWQFDKGGDSDDEETRKKKSLDKKARAFPDSLAFVRPSVCLSSVHPSVCLSIRLCVCLSLSRGPPFAGALCAHAACCRLFVLGWGGFHQNEVCHGWANEHEGMYLQVDEHWPTDRQKFRQTDRLTD
jgi:hypothetical protein